jgi:ribosomal protein L16 Arg81 hydroxylase
MIGKLPTVPAELYTINETNLLEAMIFPVKKQEFFDKFYCKKALVVRGGSQQRFSEIIKKQMFNLNILKMLENTSSKEIHVWNQPKNRSKEARVNSVPVASPQDAFNAYTKSKASLYFASNKKFDDTYMK